MAGTRGQLPDEAVLFLYSASLSVLFLYRSASLLELLYILGCGCFYDAVTPEIVLKIHSAFSFLFYCSLSKLTGQERDRQTDMMQTDRWQTDRMQIGRCRQAGSDRQDADRKDADSQTGDVEPGQNRV